MSKDYYIVILSKFPEYAHKFIDSIRRTHRVCPGIVVVRDGHQEKFGENVLEIDGEKPFVYSMNVNRAISDQKEFDFIVCNDDLMCFMPEFFNRLHCIANIDENVGILSPLIDGGVGNPLQKHPAMYQNIGYAIDMPIFEVNSTVCFPCVYIKSDMVQKIGLMDESFVGYGHDDDDYCIRARLAGFKTCITPQITIQHGNGGNELRRGENWSSSFARVEERPSNLEIFLKKYPYLASQYK
jgi:GT2 family glycosyltransferase